MKIELTSSAKVKEAIDFLKYVNTDKGLVFEVCIPDKERTDKQNNALHKFFRMLAESLNDSGLDMRKVLKPEIEIPWTESSIKENMWKPIQLAMIGHDKTSKLKTSEVDSIYKVLMKNLSEKFNVFIGFPSNER